MSRVITDVAEDEVVVTTSRPEKRKARAPATPKRMPNYAVIVWNDDDHTYQYVIEMLQKICGHSVEQAYVLADTVHHNGRAVVWTGSREVAELKRDQMRGYGPDVYASKEVTYPIGVTIEQMPE